MKNFIEQMNKALAQKIEKKEYVKDNDLERLFHQTIISCFGKNAMRSCKS